MRLLPLALVLTLTAAPLGAQSVNVDVGSFLGTPTAAYGAAAGQAGFWNSKTLNPPTSLSDLSGAATGATLAASAGNLGFGFDNPATTGNDQALLDDGCDGVRTWTFAGLANGDYELYTYAWAPDSDTFRTNVSVPGSPDPTQVVGGVWTGMHQQGVTYAKHAITVTSGTITVNITVAVSFATVNGFQLVEAAGCAAPSTYCTAKVSSSGCTPSIGSNGTPSPGGGLQVTCDNIEVNTTGVLVYSLSGAAAMPFFGGTLCLQPPNVFRTPTQGSGGLAPCSGTFVHDMNSVVVSQPTGTQVWTQFWFRDAGDANGIGLSDGLTFTTCP